MAITSSGTIRRVTSFSSDVDLTALAAGAPCRGIRADAAGTLSIVDMSGTTVAIPFAAGELQPIRATKITASGTSGVTAVTVYF